jgi:hypothetical protein
MTYHPRIKKAILDENSFISASFSGRHNGDSAWVRVTLRPVLIKNQRHLQFSYFDQRKDISKNYTGDEAAEKVDELLAMGFSNIHVHTTQGDFQVQITKKGKTILHEHKANSHAAPDLTHDRRKQLPLPADQPDAYLQAVGIMTADGRIKADMQHKFHQINEFLKLMSHTDEFQRLTTAEKPLYVVDCGCGNAYLTFAVYHYLNHVLGVPARLTGIDVNESLLASHAEGVAQLGWDKLEFVPSTIIDFQPDTQPDIVLALHACDTATDEALAQAIVWESRLIFSAPCCHHHLQAQLERQSAPAPFEPVLHHNILKERLGDILTDSLRALILRIMGYKTDIGEFVSTEHTAKNLLIRASRTAPVGERRFIEEYRALKSFWNVTPYLETLLGDAFTAIV